ncbi:MAG TPA: hypothetical protein VGC41_08070, partial [Kofleriaceae bacterium]
MQVVILERNKLVGRKVARVFASVGALPTVVEDPSALAGVVDGAAVICGDVFDADTIAEQVRARPNLRGVLWTAEPLKRSLKYLAEATRIDHVLARRDFESAPRAWELLLVAHSMILPGTVPIQAFLDWGHSLATFQIATSAHRDAMVAQLGAFIEPLAVPHRVIDMFGELAHELMMNALYDAPVDPSGRAKYAHDRKAAVQLLEHERPNVTIGTDGSRLVLQVDDPFGRLERKHVVDGLARGLAGGEQDRSHGGAGLGFLVCHNATSALFFDVVRGRSTTVTAVFELDTNLRELR